MPAPIDASSLGIADPWEDPLMCGPIKDEEWVFVGAWGHPTGRVYFYRRFPLGPHPHDP